MRKFVGFIIWLLGNFLLAYYFYLMLFTGGTLPIWLLIGAFIFSVIGALMIAFPRRPRI